MVLYFILAIVVPCIMLGVLAFRGIKNDHALVERYDRRQALEDCRHIIDLTEAQIRAIEESFDRITINRKPKEKTFFSDTILSKFVPRISGS